LDDFTDINNTSLSTKELLRSIYAIIMGLVTEIKRIKYRMGLDSVLARTHGQPALSTRLGEIGVLLGDEGKYIYLHPATLH
jgi:adenylosuccinate lyase